MDVIDESNRAAEQPLELTCMTRGRCEILLPGSGLMGHHNDSRPGETLERGECLPQPRVIEECTRIGIHGAVGINTQEDGPPCEVHVIEGQEPAHVDAMDHRFIMSPVRTPVALNRPDQERQWAKRLTLKDDTADNGALGATKRSHWTDRDESLRGVTPGGP